MKTLYPNLNILNIRCDGRSNTKEQCSCILVVLPSKRNGWENNVTDIIGIL